MLTPSLLRSDSEKCPEDTRKAGTAMMLPLRTCVTSRSVSPLLVLKLSDVLTIASSSGDVLRLLVEEPPQILTPTGDLDLLAVELEEDEDDILRGGLRLQDVLRPLVLR